jgi:hypothetical protein
VYVHGIVFGDLGVDLPFDRQDLVVEGIQERDVHLDTGANHRVGEAFAFIGAIGTAVDALFELGEVVLRVGVLYVSL